MISSLQIVFKGSQPMNKLSSAVVILLSIAGVAYTTNCRNCTWRNLTGSQCDVRVADIKNNILNPYYHLYIHGYNGTGKELQGYRLCQLVSII